MSETSHLLKALTATTEDQVLMIVSKRPELQAELGLDVTDLRRTGVTCPVINEEIVAPCEVTSCDYHTDLKRCHGCALVYATNQSASFGAVDIALLFRKPQDKIQKVLDGAMSGLRHKLKEEEATFVFYPTTGICSACEQPIEDDATQSEGLDYCSLSCLTQLPPAKAKLGYLPTRT